MFEAYKVGVTVALTNQISQGLMLIGRDLVRTDAQAKALHSTLNSIKLLGIGGAILGTAGGVGLHALGKSLEAAKEYQQELARFKAINLGDVIDRDADKFARGTSVIGASATDLIRTVKGLHTAMGDYGMAKQLAPQIAQMEYANKAIFGSHGMDFGENQLLAMHKIIEMKGGFHSTADYLKQADMTQKVISSTGGLVKPSDFFNFIQTAGVGGRLLGDESFYYTMEPLIQEMRAGRVGTGTMSAYNNLAQGHSGQRAANELMKYGLLDPGMVKYTKIGTIKTIETGALKGMGEFTSNPYGWMKDVLLPALASQGVTSKTDVMNALGAMFGNRTGSNLFSLMFMQQEKIEKNMKIAKQAMGVKELVKLAQTTPEGAELALGAAWKNLKIAAGESLLPVVIPALFKLADALRSLGTWINAHPVKFDYLVKGFAALSLAATVGGGLLVTAAGFKALGLALNIAGLGKIVTFTKALIGLPMKVLGIALRSVGLLFTSGPIGWIILGVGAAVLAGYEVYKHWSQIKPKLFTIWDGIKSWMGGIVDWLLGIWNKVQQGAGSIGREASRLFGNIPQEIGSQARGAVHWAERQVGITPPPSNKSTTVTVNTHLDGRVIAASTAKIFLDGFNKPNASGSSFDMRQSLPAPAWGQ